MRFPFLSNYKHIILYGASMAALLFLLKWIELRFVVSNHRLELYIGIIALTFTLLGIWLSKKLSTPSAKIIHPEIESTPEHTKPKNSGSGNSVGLSVRELEVLQLIAAGLSNQEIADRLFVSLNTIKTHSSKIFEKLAVERRTQAVDKARKMGIIAQ